MKMNLNEYLDARLKILSAEFEDIEKDVHKSEINKWSAQRIQHKCQELSILSNLVEEAESSYKNFFEALADSISDWLYKA